MDNLVISDVHTLPGVVLCESGLASVLVLVVVVLVWEEAGEKMSVLETRGPEHLTEPRYPRQQRTVDQVNPSSRRD